MLCDVTIMRLPWTDISKLTTIGLYSKRHGVRRREWSMAAGGGRGERGVGVGEPK
jgi:hypothetical protein